MTVNPATWTADTWAAIGSGATALAFIVSAFVLGLQLRDRHRRSAERLSAWVDDTYLRSDSGGLERRTTIHVANVGDQPVFDVVAVVGHGHVSSDVARLGPLGFPTLPVLAPGKEEIWPVEERLKSFEIAGEVRVEVSFRDSAGRWWTRQFDGGLKRWRRSQLGVRVDNSPAALLRAEAQMGAISLDNPVAVAMMFKVVLGDDDSEERLESLHTLSTPESIPTWDYSAARDALREHGMATFPIYPAPDVAYVKLPPDADDHLTVTGPVLMEMSILTLQYRRDVDPPGWRVHAAGPATPPDQMPPAPAADADRG